MHALRGPLRPGGAYALRWGPFVNVEAIYIKFSPRTGGDGPVHRTLFYAFVGTLLWLSAPWAWESLRVMEYSNSTWGPYVWQLKLTIPAAAFLVLLQGMTRTIKDLHFAITGRELLTGSEAPSESQV